MSTIFIILQLIFLEGILSIDNAAVLGAMVAHLPTHEPLIWPPPLKALGAALHPLLGNQRTAALRAGLLGAYVGRGLMLTLASVVVRNPWLRVLGAAYLVRLACDNLGLAEPGEADAHVHPLVGRNFWNIVVTVELADLAFSLDNVVAAVALSSQLWVVLLGVALGILLMRFAAGWFSYAVEREPVLKTAAYVLVFNVGVELLLDQFGVVHFTDWARLGIAVGTLLLALAYAHLPQLRVFQPLFTWLGEGFANFNEVFDWVLEPVEALARLAWRGLGRLARRFQHHQRIGNG
jgi:tellurite resistance protein TerC